MLLSSRTRLLGATLSLTAVYMMTGPESGALAQMSDSALIQTLTTLAVRTGFKDTPVGQNGCKYIEIPDDGRCLVYQCPFEEKDGYNHSVNVADRKGSRFTFLAKVRSDTTDMYLVDTHGIVIKFAYRRREGSSTTWSTKPVEDEEVIRGYRAELAYWRTKLDQKAGLNCKD